MAALRRHQPTFVFSRFAFFAARCPSVTWRSFTRGDSGFSICPVAINIVSYARTFMSGFPRPRFVDLFGITTSVRQPDCQSQWLYGLLTFKLSHYPGKETFGDMLKEAGRSVTTVSLKSAAAICSRFVRVQCSATFHCDSGGFDFQVEQLSHLRRIARPEAFQVVLSCTSRY